MELRHTVSMDTILTADNICDHMDPDDISLLGEDILKNYKTDKNSRSEWEERYAEALKLAMQLMEERSFPWPNSSNAKFPLITISALQYHARAYPALLRGPQPVNARVIGADTTGQKSARAKRISGHMSFQIIEEDTQWEESFDRMLIVQAVLGCAFRKTYYDGGLKHIVSELVLPKDLVINYWSRSLDTAPRITHVLGLYPNEIEERIRRGLFSADPFDKENTRKIEASSSNPTDVVSAANNDIDGTQQPATDSDTPITILEHHFTFDLDGDGYREPLIGYVREDTGELVRLVGRFEKDHIERNAAGETIKISPERYFTQYTFIPAPDGSVYGMGFGMLLGATNEVINTLINQLIDAGTMATLGGGFLARGIKIRGGDYTFRPQEWKRTDSTGNDLKTGIFPLPIKEPSPVLFQLLSLMIDVGQKIGMATDALTGENPGQNQKVGTTQAVIQQGEKVFNGIYKRTYRALKNEFRLIYRLNYLNPPADGIFNYASDGQKADGGVAFWQDYFDSDRSVVPTADPSISSLEAIAQRDMTVLQLSNSVPGFNKYEIMHRILENMEYPNIDKVFPPPGSPGAPPPPVPPQMQIQQLKNQAKQLDLQGKLQLQREKLQAHSDETAAKIRLLTAQAALASSQAGLADGQKFTALMDAELQAAQIAQEHTNTLLDHIGQLTQMQQQQGQQGPGEQQSGNPDQGSVGQVAQPTGNPGGAGGAAGGSPQPGG